MPKISKYMHKVSYICECIHVYALVSMYVRGEREREKTEEEREGGKEGEGERDRHLRTSLVRTR